MTPQERRLQFRQGLHELYLPYYDQMCALLDPLKWGPYFGVRTIDQQAALYAQGRTAPGHIVTHAPAGSSAHNYGCASDWAYFKDGNLIWLAANDPLWTEYFQAGDQAKVTLGARWTSPDTDHNELKIAHSWTDIYQELVRNGETAANDLIASSHDLSMGELNAPS